MIEIQGRNIAIPQSLKNIVTQNDENSKSIIIKMPKYIDGIDISQKSIWIKSVSDGGRHDEQLQVLENADSYITCNWVLKPPVTSFDGELAVQIRVISENYKWESAQGTFNIIESLDADPVIPITPNFIDDAIEKIGELSTKAENSAKIATEKADISTKKADEAKESETNANDSADKAKQSETSSALSEINAKSSETNSKDYAEQAKASADKSKTSEIHCSASETNSKNYYNVILAESSKTKKEADRAKLEADRAKLEADKVSNLVNVVFQNPLTLEYQRLQQILDSTFYYLFDLIRNLHFLGFTWTQIDSKSFTWAQIDSKNFTWNEIAILNSKDH